MIIRTKKELEFVLMSDMMMNRGKFHFTIKDRLIHILFPDYIMRYLKYMRKTSYYGSDDRKGGLNKFLYLWYSVRFFKMGAKLGFSIGSDCMGLGVVIPHYGTIVVGGSNRIGNFAVLHTSTCISDNGKVIGEALYLGTGVKMTSKIVLGDNISIGANSMVNKTFKENNVLLAGMPATMIKETQAWYLNTKFEERVNKITALRNQMGL